MARLESVGDVKALLEWAAGRPEAEERVRAEIGRKVGGLEGRGDKKLLNERLLRASLS